jgi:hypothetical protein
MTTKLYYTIEKETEFIKEVEECTGMKNIAVYEIVKDKPELWFELDVPNEDRADESIDEWLIDNGFEDRQYDFIQL